MVLRFCGNLRAVKPSLRCSRERGASAVSGRVNASFRGRSPSLRTGLGLGLLLGVWAGCGSKDERTDEAEGGRQAPASQASASTPADAPAPGDAAAPLDDDALAERYVAIREALDAEPPPSAAVIGTLEADLKEIANTARDMHLRANASLVLGSILEGKGDRTGAIGHYRHAAKLVPDDAGPHMALARGLAAAGDHAAALEAQQQATDRDPDNLENWLALAELSLRAGEKERAGQAYVDYERRRKGLIDGLTLKNKAGEYLVSEDERIACAEALAAASDAGTAVALLYALVNVESAKVRATVATVMGIQRLAGFTDVLKARQTAEVDPDVQEAVQWALGEIARDPIDIEPGPRAALDPEDPRANPKGAPSDAKTPGDGPKPAE
jgi:tetratricopeptide (TPR) repeat protein